MRTVKSFDKSGSLCEIYSTGFQLAFASPELEQCHSWVLCKDFLTDAVWATVNKGDVQIYGFRFNHKINPAISIKPVYLIARNKQVKNDIFDKCMENCQKFMNMLEVKLKFTLCKFEKIKYTGEGEYSVWLMTFDPKWLHAPPMVSMLSLMIRVGCHYSGKGYLNAALRKFKLSVKAKQQKMDSYDGDTLDEIDGFEALHNDAEYLRQSYAMRTLIFKNGLKIFKPTMAENYPNDVDVHTVHNHWGIVEARKFETFKTLWDLSGIEVIKEDLKKKKEAKKETVKKVSK